MRAGLVIAAATVGLAALLAPSGPAYAGNFSITPLRVDFGSGSAPVALTVRNEDSAPVVIQAEALVWSQQNGQDNLEPTRDLLVSPAVFTVPPGESQLVRVALRREQDATRELSYRIMLQEVPPATQPGFTGLQVSLRMSVPAFVAPRAPAGPQLGWQLAQEADGKATVVVRNSGNAHERVRRFTIKTLDGAVTLLEQPAMTYVLPGAERRWAIDDKNNIRTNAGSTSGAAAAAPYRLEGNTDRGPFATELQLPVR